MSIIQALHFTPSRGCAALFAFVIVLALQSAPQAESGNPPAVPEQTRTLRDVERESDANLLKLLDTYTREHKDAPDIVEAYEKLIAAAGRLGEFPKASVFHSRFESDHPGHAGLVRLRATYSAVMIASKNVEAALKAVTLAVEKIEDPEQVCTLLEDLAWLQTMAGDVKGAEASYTKLIDHPSLGENNELRKACRLRIKDLENYGKAFEHFSVRDMDGQKLESVSFKGKYLVVDFWATWSRECERELPELVRLYRAYHDKGLELVGVSLDTKDGEKKLREMIAKEGAEWHHFFDGKKWDCELAAKYGVRRIPTRVLVNPEGKIVSWNMSDRQLAQALTYFFDK